jgi:hypothetical protein
MHLKYLPTVLYDFGEDEKSKPMLNIIRRFAFNPKAQLDRAIFLPYKVTDGDTPQSLADSLYGSPKEDWLVYMINNVIDPVYGWVMLYDVLVAYAKLKYDDIYAVHHREDADGDYVDEFYIGAQAVTNIEHEIYLNEKKRNIILLEPAYFNKVKQEAISMFND